MDGQHGGHKGWTWLYRGLEVGTMPGCTRAGLPMVARRGSEVKKESRIRVTNPENGEKSVHGCTEGGQRECGGVQKGAQRGVRVHKWAKKGAEGCTKVCKVHAGAQKVQKGAQVCMQVRGRVRRWGQSPGRVGGWCGCGGCRPSAEKVKS